MTTTTTPPTQVSRRLAPLALLVGALLALATDHAAAQMMHTYENTTTGTISNAATPCSNPLVRSFTVTDSFTVNRIAVGFNASHTRRGHIQMTLRAPNNSTVQLITESGDRDNNYDILLSSNTEGGLDDDDTDPVGAPYYNRLVSVAGIDSFYTGNSSGTWSVETCDTVADTNGTFNRAYLMLGSSEMAPTRCSGTVSYDWGTPGAVTPLTGNPVTVGDITISQASTADYAGTASEAFVMRPTTNGDHLGYYGLSMDATAIDGTQDNEVVGLTSVIGFSAPVTDLRFTLLDVDITNNAWEDQLQLIGTDTSGSRVPYTLSPVGAAAQLAGDTAEGDVSAATTSTAGNLNVAFAGAISSLTMNYTQGSNPASENVFMVIGISDFVQCAYDFGDAPATYGTPLANGPKHALGSRNIYLGDQPPDGESDGQDDATAIGDDDAAIDGITDDEDGNDDFGFDACPQDGTYAVSMTVNNSSGSTGHLVGYIDWNRDGDFADANERSSTESVPTTTTNGTETVTWSSVPANCGGTTATYARFRFTTDSTRAESPTDSAGVYAPDGEVEDYEIDDTTLPVTIASVDSAADGDALTVRWTTASEWANAGFRLLGRSDGSDWALLGEIAAHGPDSFTPQRYEATVAAAGVTEITIEDISLFGETRAHGPFAVGERAGEEPVGMTVDWAAIRSEVDLAPARAALSVGATSVSPNLRKGPSGAREGLLLVREAGIQRVTYEELLAAGVDLVGIAPDRIAVVNNGAGVPRHVATAGSTFGAGSFIEFVAEPELTLASPFDAYVLTVNRRQAKPVAGLGVGAGDLALTEAADVYRPNRAYSFASPNGDPWFDQGVFARGNPASATRTFDLPNLREGTIELEVRTWGYGASPGIESPDHHVVVVLNGTEIANSWFDGLITWERTVDVTGVAQATGNVLELRVPGDTGFKFDYIAFEGFSVRYPRQTVAVAQRFAGTVAADGFAIGGFDEGQAVSLWLNDGGTWRRGEQTASQGRVALPSGGDVFAAALPALVKPGISAGVPAALASSKAEYLIVSHPAFADSLADLVALEESRGLATEIVTVDRIYAAYGDHAPSAEAVQRFLTTSWEKGKLKYVLVVGADTTDPYNHLGTGSVSYVPTFYLPYVEYITFSPTDETLVDADGDLVGEVPIGRLPVRTPTELQQVVAKIRAWEQNIAAGARDALLTAGAADAHSSFAAINRSYSASLGGWNGATVTAEEQGVAAVRDAVLAAMNAGTPLVSFVGHSSMGQWDFTPILRWQDVAGFTNAGRPNLVAQWGCWNSYYVEPGTESLSARMLITPNNGAAAAIGATTLTSDVSHQRLGNLFYAAVNGGAATVGDAFHNAKRELRTQAIAHDAILGMALLGDPAMSLPR